MVEAARLRSDGFKRVDLAERNGDLNTGFDKMEMMLKARVNTDPDESIFHQGEVKLGYAREVSNETYLGLTDADFAVDPFRRYVASARDRMEWNRFLAEVSYGLAVGTDFRMRVTGYRHEFSRAWFKVNSFEGAQPLGDILAEPTGGQRAIFYGVLSGARDSEQETLLIGTNDRTFV